jgi:hypothetical protein
MGNGNVVLANPGTPNLSNSAAPRNDAAYEDFYPYYAELCALSELRKTRLGVPCAAAWAGTRCFTSTA